MELSTWAILSVIFKFFLYLTTSIAVGAGFIRKLAGDDNILQRSIDRYWSILILSGIGIAMSYFFVQVGGFVEEGFEGILNMEYAIMLWQSSMGDAVNYQVLGFLLIWLSKFVYQWWGAINPKIKKEYLSIPVFLIGVFFLARSFSMVGHTAEYGLIFQLILSLHVICVAWWIGALFPLRRACQLLNTQSLFRLMDRFGKWASVVVTLLISSGATIVILFAKGSLDIFKTNYGLILLAKFLMVGFILLFALYHKLKLVPLLKQEANVHTVLRRSITKEIVIALLILVITATLTTAAGNAA